LGLLLPFFPEPNRPFACGDEERERRDVKVSPAAGALRDEATASLWRE
jgi:hypothetical protein